MNATATAPKTASRRHDTAVKVPLPAPAEPAAYKRPEATYSAPIGLTVKERVANLEDTFHKAIRQFELAQDAVEKGTALDILLRLIANDLLVKAMSPIVRADPDDASTPVTKEDAADAYEALFPLLAALEGATVLALGTPVQATLTDAFRMLDWAQEECDSTALGALLPTQTPDDEAYVRFTEALGVIETAALALQGEPERSALVYAARALMRHELEPLFKAVTEEPNEEALSDASTAISVIVDLIDAAATVIDDQCLWGALTLAQLSHDEVDNCIGRVMRRGQGRKGVGR